LFTLNFPVRIPNEHTYFDGGRHPVPLLPGGLSFGCVDAEDHPLVLRITGFHSEQEALDFCPTLRKALQWASLDSEHSITPSDTSPIISTEKHFDGSIPTVTFTNITALPYFFTASSQNGEHISVLSKQIGAALAHGAVAKMNANSEFSLAVELYANHQFAGERNARFIVLMTALEILVPKTSSRGKRSTVIAMVKDALSKSGHTDPKATGKHLDSLYVARNELVHEAKSVSDADLKALKEIVRSTLTALIS
jgi:hypothetical protein